MSLPRIYLHAARVFCADTEPLQEQEIKEVRKKFSLRRSDRFTSLAVTAVKREMDDHFPAEFSADTGLLTVSTFGPHKTVFATLDDILDYPEDLILPTKFSHSVQNAAASYLGTILGIQGPAFSLTGFERSLYETMEFAAVLLSRNVCPQILLVGIEEQGALTQAAPSLYPERFSAEPAETVCALVLSGHDAPHALPIEMNRAAAAGKSEDIFAFGCTRTEFFNLAGVASWRG